MLYGRGAGDLPTGSAVVSDIISILRSGVDNFYAPVAVVERKDLKFNSMGMTECEYYIRITVKDVPGTLGQIAAILGKHGVSLSSVIQKSKQGSKVTLVFVTHQTREVNINTAVDEIKDIQTVCNIENIIRVEKF
jgi:homoserine dehydrogenase